MRDKKSLGLGYKRLLASCYIYLMAAADNKPALSSRQGISHTTRVWAWDTRDYTSPAWDIRDWYIYFMAAADKKPTLSSWPNSKSYM